MRWSWIERPKHVWTAARRALRRPSAPESKTSLPPTLHEKEPEAPVRQELPEIEAAPDDGARPLVLGDVATAALDEFFEEAQRSILQGETPEPLSEWQ